MQMDERATGTPILGIFRGGVVRLLDAVQWQEGSRVEVRVVDTGQDVPPSKVGLVIIAGLGLAGRWVADIFDRHSIEYVTVEQNPDTVRRQKRLGKKIILGDISEESTLVAAGVDKASILALTVPDEPAVLKATSLARKLQPNIYIIARTQYSSSGMEARQLGADAVVKAEQAVANRFYELILHKLRSSTGD